MELRMSARLLHNLHSNWDTLLYHCSNLVIWEILLLSPPICLVCLQLLLKVQILRCPLLCMGHIVIIPSFLWYDSMRLICSFPESGDLLVVSKPCR